MSHTLHTAVALLPIGVANDCVPYFKQEFPNYLEHLDTITTPQAARFTLAPQVNQKLPDLIGPYEPIHFEDPKLFPTILML